MYEYLKRMYLAGTLSDAGLQNAVTKRWITQEQADQIRAEKNAQPSADELLLSDLENPTS